LHHTVVPFFFIVVMGPLFKDDKCRLLLRGKKRKWFGTGWWLGGKVRVDILGQFCAWIWSNG